MSQNGAGISGLTRTNAPWNTFSMFYQHFTMFIFEIMQVLWIVEWNSEKCGNEMSTVCRGEHVSTHRVLLVNTNTISYSLALLQNDFRKFHVPAGIYSIICILYMQYHIIFLADVSWRPYSIGPLPHFDVNPPLYLLLHNPSVSLFV